MHYCVISLFRIKLHFFTLSTCYFPLDTFLFTRHALQSMNRIAVQWYVIPFIHHPQLVCFLGHIFTYIRKSISQCCYFCYLLRKLRSDKNNLLYHPVIYHSWHCGFFFFFPFCRFVILSGTTLTSVWRIPVAFLFCRPVAPTPSPSIYLKMFLFHSVFKEYFLWIQDSENFFPISSAEDTSFVFRHPLYPMRTQQTLIFMFTYMLRVFYPPWLLGRLSF